MLATDNQKTLLQPVRGQDTQALPIRGPSKDVLQLVWGLVGHRKQQSRHPSPESFHPKPNSPPPHQRFQLCVGRLQGFDWPREQKRDKFAGKVCLSSTPLKGKKRASLVFYGCGKKLGVTRIADPRWTSISCNWWPYQDTVFHEGKFYAVNHREDAVAVDVCRRLAKKIASTPDDCYIFKSYIVKSRGELFQVIRDAVSWTPGPLDYKTLGFRVYRLVDFETGGWERITSLGNQALFLGSNNSISVSAEGIAKRTASISLTTESFGTRSRVGSRPWACTVWRMEASGHTSVEYHCLPTHLLCGLRPSCGPNSLFLFSFQGNMSSKRCLFSASVYFPSKFVLLSVHEITFNN